LILFWMGECQLKINASLIQVLRNQTRKSIRKMKIGYYSAM